MTNPEPASSTTPIVSLDTGTPSVADTAWVAPTARVIGSATVHELASVWYTAVVRADLESITIGPESNVQDGSVLHADPGRPVVIGARVTIGHRAVVHGAVIEDDVLVGMGSIVLNGARVGAGSVIGAGALVPEGMAVPPRSLVLGVPGRVRGGTTEEQVRGIAVNAAHYVALAERHRAAHAADGRHRA